MINIARTLRRLRSPFSIFGTFASFIDTPGSDRIFFRQNIRIVQNRSKRGKLCMVVRAKRSHAGPAVRGGGISFAGGPTPLRRGPRRTGTTGPNGGQLAQIEGQLVKIVSGTGSASAPGAGQLVHFIFEDGQLVRIGRSGRGFIQISPGTTGSNSQGQLAGISFKVN